MATVKLNWNRKTVPQKMVTGGFVVQQMTLNVTVFATPNPDLVTVDAALSDLADKTVAAEAGGYLLTFDKNEAEKVLDDLISQLMSYVQNVSGGDEAVILLSGMEVRKSPSPVPPPLQVENLDAFPTRNQGEI
ncbi:MAG: hypothetical protein JKX84_08775, partial [Flavobacteriales bacterium]|nr:hypothetical protein [Flavobacteriales bacterium]